MIYLLTKNSMFPVLALAIILIVLLLITIWYIVGTLMREWAGCRM
jgi:hypothetical protein